MGEPLAKKGSFCKGFIFLPVKTKKIEPPENSGKKRWGKMTNGEYLIMQRDRHSALAIKKLNAKDYTGVQMHKNIANGFQLKLEKMTVAELEALHD